MASIADYIRQAAISRGIDPEIALRVYMHEGAGTRDYQSGIVKNGVREPSYGPFQLYTGGGLGNVFQKETGLDPADPSTWRQNIDFALNKVVEGGWGPWYGARNAGIFNKDGVAPDARTLPLSGVFDGGAPVARPAGTAPALYAPPAPNPSQPDAPVDVASAFSTSFAPQFTAAQNLPAPAGEKPEDFDSTGLFSPRTFARERTKTRRLSS